MLSPKEKRRWGDNETRRVDHPLALSLERREEAGKEASARLVVCNSLHTNAMFVALALSKKKGKRVSYSCLNGIA